MIPLNPGVAPAPTATAPTATPQSQYLAAALKQLQGQQIGSPAQLGERLLSQALMQQGQIQANNKTQSPIGPQQNGPLSGLMGLGQKALTGVQNMFGGANG
jgi:hypothetical protein